MREGYAELGTVRLHYVEQGEGPLVVLLHGFPEFWFGWRHQLGPLAEAGFRVVAPDMRGYNLSSKPPRVSDYTLDVLARDVRDLIAERGEESACVAGHDWGGAVAWAAAMYHPEAVRRLAILNAPHPRAFARALRDPRQLAKSWYMGFFQLPFLPEQLGRRVFPRGFPEEVRDRYEAAYDQPGALTAMLNYYRALPRRPVTSFPPGHGRDARDLGPARQLPDAGRRRAGPGRRAEPRARDPPRHEPLGPARRARPGR